MKRVLEGARRKALDLLHDETVGVTDSDVRANVFCPRYRDVTNDWMFSLAMASDIKVGMSNPIECGITFFPGQGAVGQAYVTRGATIAVREPDGWGADQNLAALEASKIHRDLRWVLAVPLLDPQSSEPLGVACIDGLRHEVPEDTLGRIWAHVEKDMSVLGGILAQHPRVELSSGVILDR